jgi:hypothetical protein
VPRSIENPRVREHSAGVKRALTKTANRLGNILVPLAAVIALCRTEPLNAQQPGTTEAFDQYIVMAESRISKERNSSFLWIESLSLSERTDLTRELQHGEIVIEKHGSTPEQIPDGLIHDWVGTVFIPKTTVAQVIALVRDYDHTANHYAPDVMRSRLMSANGDNLHVLMRLRKNKVLTVILDTEYDVHYGRLDAAHEYSDSRSTRVSEIVDPGTPNEHSLPSGEDHGFMWRLNSYWAFEQTKDGVFVQCEAVSLTRDIPNGLGWMIGPFVSSIPRESLQFTLNATRAAVVGKALASGHE